MFTLTFAVLKETKNAVRFQEIDEAGQPQKRENQVIGSLYLSKAALNHTVPARVTVTVDTA